MFFPQTAFMWWMMFMITLILITVMVNSMLYFNSTLKIKKTQKNMKMNWKW